MVVWPLYLAEEGKRWNLERREEASVSRLTKKGRKKKRQFPVPFANSRGEENYKRKIEGTKRTGRTKIPLLRRRRNGRKSRV